MTDIDPLFMQAIIGYHKARQEFAEFYKSALLYLAYTSVKSLSESFKLLMPGVVKIKEGYNPATWMLEVIAPSQEMTLGVDFTNLYKNSDLQIHIHNIHSTSLRDNVLGSRSKSQDLFNIMGSMYAVVLFLGVQNASSVQPVVDVEHAVFYRERAARMYSAIPYAFGQLFIEIPYVFVQAVSYGIIIDAMIGFEWAL
ncbi:Pleiotropic drug resistance protein 1 [Capsicum baccatum]|uniref:Pleiotropic drug resistance protein 1 n=1 Tax=Capsicum baccatum TaxID=33114 RepID=A0A2G2WN07_CAPBA|nr:Pleiotropic drug resistance protein 1 [Capsicum baccatum]